MGDYIKKFTTYNFEVKLEYLDEYKPKHEFDYYCAPFQVLADDIFEAQRILEDWLSDPKQTGWKYKTWVGITPLPTNSIIIDPKFSLIDEDGFPIT